MCPDLGTKAGYWADRPTCWSAGHCIIVLLLHPVFPFVRLQLQMFSRVGLVGIQLEYCILMQKPNLEMEQLFS